MLHKHQPRQCDGILCLTCWFTHHRQVVNSPNRIFTRVWRWLVPTICLFGNKIVDHSDVVRASPVGAARPNTWLRWIGQRQLQDKMKSIKILGLGATYIRGLTVYEKKLSMVHTECLCKQSGDIFVIHILEFWILCRRWSPPPPPQCNTC